jgi:chemotaxis protein CheD
MGGETFKVNMGELKVGHNGDILAAYGVGSCIIVACYDRTRPVAAMLHGILPEKIGKAGGLENKYLNIGIDNMVKELIREGVSINEMEAKIFGGAKMFDVKLDSETIGERNIRMAKEELKKKNIRLTAEDTGSNYGRSIEFSVLDKRAVVKSFQKGTIII